MSPEEQALRAKHQDDAPYWPRDSEAGYRVGDIVELVRDIKANCCIYQSGTAYGVEEVKETIYEGRARMSLTVGRCDLRGYLIQVDGNDVKPCSQEKIEMVKLQRLHRQLNHLYPRPWSANQDGNLVDGRGNVIARIAERLEGESLIFEALSAVVNGVSGELTVKEVLQAMKEKST